MTNGIVRAGPQVFQDDATTALQLRVQAARILEAAGKLDGMQPFLVTHVSKFNAKTYVLWHKDVPKNYEAIDALALEFNEDLDETIVIEAAPLKNLTGDYSEFVRQLQSQEEPDNPSPP